MKAAVRVKIYQLKANDSDLNVDQLCLGNISKDFTNDDMKQTGFNGYLHDFSFVFGILMLVIFLIFINI